MRGNPHRQFWKVPRYKIHLPFTDEQVVVTPVPFKELSELGYGVTTAVVETEAYLIVLIDQLHAWLPTVAQVTVAESECHDLVGVTMNVIVATRPLDYGFRAIVANLKLADHVRRYAASSSRCDKFPEFADVRDQLPEQPSIHYQPHLRNYPNTKSLSFCADLINGFIFYLPPSYIGHPIRLTVVGA
jgi:hypothetical protein